MPNTKLTKEKLSVHFQYGKMIYVVIIVVAALIGNLTYTMTAYHAPNERRIDIELIGLYADPSSEAATEAAARLLAAGQESERARDAARGVDTAAADYEAPLQELQFLSLQYDPESSSEESYYAAQKYMVMLAAQEGDIYVLSRSLMVQLADQGTLVPLDDYIESGVIDPGDRQLGRVTFDEVDDNGLATGEQHVYALQASTLTGMYSTLSYDPTDKYLAIVAFSQNQDTAAAVLQEMIDMFEPDEAVEEETAEAAQ
ncbi:MAG: hypothetical protein J5602_13975 [Clostridia bacterium]|nr:hypothetical protein [Clostridia bacterium]MBO4886415.1 hypothetical protein [Clostridia bacterium]